MLSSDETLCFSRFSQTGARTRTTDKNGSAIGSGFSSRGRVQFCRPEVRVAWIRKTKIQPSVQGLILTDQTDPGSTVTQLDRGRRGHVRQTRAAESACEVSETLKGSLCVSGPEPASDLSVCCDPGQVQFHSRDQDQQEEVRESLWSRVLQSRGAVTQDHLEV